MTRRTNSNAKLAKIYATMVYNFSPDERFECVSVTAYIALRE